MADVPELRTGKLPGAAPDGEPATGDARPTGGRKPATAVPSAESLEALRGARILLAEDNPVNRQVAVTILVAAGARVDEAYDGIQALELISPGQYDLVLMDLLMPGMDGLEVTRRLRARAEFDTLPILALTALDGDEDGDACVAAGIDERIVKPISAVTLTEVAGRWLRRGRRP